MKKAVSFVVLLFSVFVIHACLSSNAGGSADLVLKNPDKILPNTQEIIISVIIGGKETLVYQGQRNNTGFEGPYKQTVELTETKVDMRIIQKDADGQTLSDELFCYNLQNNRLIGENKIILRPSKITLDSGISSTAITVLFFPDDMEKSLRWASSAAFVRVDSTGFITAVTPGQALVIARSLQFPAVSDTVFVTVPGPADTEQDTSDAPPDTSSIRPPRITLHPAGVSVTAGTSAAFTCLAEGDSVAYLWLKNGKAAEDGDSAAFSIPDPQSGDSGAAFNCIASNSAGTDTSAAAVLSVTHSIDPPEITGISESPTVNEGEPASFSVTAAGTNLKYQWRKDGVDIDGATSGSFQIAITSSADNGARFTCIVFNPQDTIASGAITLTIISDPTSDDLIAPVISFSSHTNGQVVTASPIDFQVSIHDTSGIASVTILGDTTTSSDSLYIKPITLQEGGNAISVTAVDNSANRNTAKAAFSIILDSPPPAVENLRITEVTNTAITIQWDPIPNGGDFVMYSIYYSNAPGVDQSSTFAGTITTRVLTILSITDLVPDQDCFLKVFTHDETSATPSLEISTRASPNAPAVLIASVQSASALSLSWPAVPGASYYTVFHSFSEVGPFDSVGTSADTSFTADQLESNTRHWFKVSAANAGGPSPLTEPATAATLPESPLEVSASPVSSTGVRISWSYPGAHAAGLLFRVFRSTSENGAYEQISNESLGASSPFTDNALSPGDMLYYKVSAINAGGESSLSQAAAAQTLPAVPGPVTPSPLAGALTLTWPPAAGASGYTLFHIPGTSLPDTSAAVKISVSGTTATLTGLDYGQPYTVALKALNSSGGASDLSTPATIKTPVWGGMKLIPSKNISFEMGDHPTYTSTHMVSFTYNFWIDSTELTQEEYSKLMSITYESFIRPSWNMNYDGTQGHPVYNVNWFDAVLYCNARSIQAGLDTVYRYTSIAGIPGDSSILSGLTVDVSKNGYRLPTSAEWEFACRAGTSTLFYWGGEDAIDDYAWYSGNSSNRIHPVAQKQPNSFGLYDMSGNVGEKCNNWSGPTVVEAEVDPYGPVNGTERISRDGGFNFAYYYQRSGIYAQIPPSDTHYYNGFRVSLPLR